MKLTVKDESWPLKTSFQIARGSKNSAETVTVTLSDGGHKGRGECLPYRHYGETVEDTMATIKSMSGQLDEGLNRLELQKALPPGAARNALDCAFWDLEAKQQGVRIWTLLGLEPPSDITTAFTLSLDTPQTMLVAAKKNADQALLKIKLGGPEDLDCVRAVRRGAPKARLILDANEGWTPESYAELIPDLLPLDIEMIEQPFAADDDSTLLEIERPIPICADESCHDSRSLDGLLEKYDMINIKLDKTGGLTEALTLCDLAQKAGMEIMVGCMVSTSLSMAPAMVLANQARIVDLDGPLLLAKDRKDGLAYHNSQIGPPTKDLWG